MSSPSADNTLTAREREILALIVAGRPKAEIADLLVVSQFTIERHIQRIRAKLQTWESNQQN
jgi:DNA-binding CsgD family transcriptional regulator